MENGKTEGCEQSEAIRRRFKPLPIDVKHSPTRLTPERKDLKNFTFQKGTSATKRVKKTLREGKYLSIGLVIASIIIFLYALGRVLFYSRLSNVDF